jgi:hypothetical protein
MIGYTDDQLTSIWTFKHGQFGNEAFAEFLALLHFLDDIRTGAPSTSEPRKRAIADCGKCGAEGHRAPQCKGAQP